MIRVRFAPSPTGMMHLGNVRVALFNYLFAQQKKGKFLLRIEDTDLERNIPGSDLKIIEDLAWLGLSYDEGPGKEGLVGPYLQSDRSHIYKSKLSELIDGNKVYRCFCTVEELEAKRKRQIKLKMPPVYDRSCLRLSDDMIKAKLIANISFAWRFKLNQESYVELVTFERGVMRFGLNNFSDPVLTRADGLVTFIFANFIDDWLMKITHIIRGEDHLSNSAVQAAMFIEFAIPVPVYWHLPFVCNVDGKKLSKRDFGFSLDDLSQAGFLPEAILNYLAALGSSLVPEVQSLDELCHGYNFSKVSGSGPIRFDIDKLTWFNHQWINRCDVQDLTQRVRPFLIAKIAAAQHMSDAEMSFLILKIQKEMKHLTDAATFLSFVFEEPTIILEAMSDRIGKQKVTQVMQVVKKHLDTIEQQEAFLFKIKNDAKSLGLKNGDLFCIIRYALIGNFEGIGIHDLLQMLPVETV
ncbi:MAG TPA: glutamate--tRNA ligase, partial [Candidatus Babeliales bacterium]|nr:glutamate--tRNA ligase [Candidatus Babeliales bacterium]